MLYKTGHKCSCFTDCFTSVIQEPSMSHDMTKPTKWLCAQRRLRSAWASAQSNQSLRCPHEESLGPWLPIERTAKTLIRLGGCPGWSESSLGAQSLCWFCHVAAQVYTVYKLIKRNETTLWFFYYVAVKYARKSGNEWHAVSYDVKENAIFVQSTSQIKYRTSVHKTILKIVQYYLKCICTSCFRYFRKTGNLSHYFSGKKKLINISPYGVMLIFGLFSLQ